MGWEKNLRKAGTDITGTVTKAVGDAHRTLSKADRDVARAGRKAMEDILRTARAGNVTITVTVILDRMDPTEDTLAIGFRGLGGWYEPSNELISQETVKKFKARKNTGPHYLEAITSTGPDGVVVRSARTLVSIGNKDKKVTLRPS